MPLLEAIGPARIERVDQERRARVVGDLRIEVVPLVGLDLC